jgi:hypothetical protein
MSTAVKPALVSDFWLVNARHIYSCFVSVRIYTDFRHIRQGMHISGGDDEDSEAE